MKKIILDTNFLVLPFQFNIDIYDELNRIIDEKYELIIISPEIDELLKLKFGKAAYELAIKKGVKIVKVEVDRGVDAAILNFAKKENAIIATQDKELKRKARKAELNIITMRQKKYLVLI